MIASRPRKYLKVGNPGSRRSEIRSNLTLPTILQRHTGVLFQASFVFSLLERVGSVDEQSGR
jgi:hypothetical protein